MKKIILIALLLIPSLCFAEEDPIDKLEQECMKKDYSPSGMNACTQKSYELWDGDSKKIYKMLMNVLDDEEKQQLKDSQNAWFKYRDLEIKFRMNSLMNNEGTLFSNLAMAEKLSIIKQRVKELKSMHDLLKEARE